MGWGIRVSDDNRSNGNRHFGSKDLQCTITPKVHLMLGHVEWQMANIEGGLCNKMEDWVERLHQTGKRQRLLHYRTVQNPVVHSLAREKANLRNMHPDVIAQTDKINKGSKHNLVEQKADLVGMLRKRQCDVGRFEAMKISRRTITRDSPGRPHYLITQRRVRRMLTASNICVILKKKFRARSCDDLWLKKGVSF